MPPEICIYSICHAFSSILLLLTHLCTFFCSPVLVHRHITWYTSKGAPEQIHSWPKRGGDQCHQEVPPLCSQGVCHPQRGDGFIQEEKVRTHSS